MENFKDFHLTAKALTYFRDFYLTAKARIWPRLSYRYPGQNLALTVLCVPNSLDLEGPGAARAVCQHVRDVVIVHQVLGLEPPVEEKKLEKNKQR